MKKSWNFNEEDLLHAMEDLKNIAHFPIKYVKILQKFYANYKKQIIKEDLEKNIHIKLFFTLIDILKSLAKHPFSFEAYHKKIRKPFDYYQFGIDFFSPLVIKEKSQIFGERNIQKILQQLENKENIVFFANHQSETDPQCISILLEKYPALAQRIIYVAGERVITDPLAIPFSMGCDLLCIYSKKYIETPVEKKQQKQLHNTKTMHLMRTLLKEGNKIIYVAPSGGRDRPNKHHKIEIAPFDPQSIEMFYLMAKRSSFKTHFYPLSLDTYHLIPPPDTRVIEMGENRYANRVPIKMIIGDEIDMENIDGNITDDKVATRQNRCHYIYNMVVKNYQKLITGDFNENN